MIDTHSTPLPISPWRKDFPSLGEVHYLDTAATALVPRCVTETMERYYTEYPANVHRAFYDWSEKATEQYESARAEIVARFKVSCGIFTRGTTESINMVAQSWARPNMGPGDTILLTAMEHHSNLIPWQMLAQQTGARLRFVPVTSDGTLDLNAAEELIKQGPKLLALTWASNVNGVINPIEQLGKLAKAQGVRVLIDAAQSVPHQLICSPDCYDFLAFSGHKVYGPTGIGALLLSAEAQAELQPWMGGGEMVDRVTLESHTLSDPPQCFEAGTPPIAGAIGLAAAFNYLQQQDQTAWQQRENLLLQYARDKLAAIPGLFFFPAKAPTISLLSFTVEGLHPHDAAQFCNEHRVALRGGSLCAQPFLQQFGLRSVLRLSLSAYNESADIDALCAALNQAREFFAL